MAGDPYRYFRVEARELLEELGQGALDLEKDLPSDALIARMLRAAHTLKGAARVVRQPRIAEDAHAIEDLFAAMRDRTEPVPRDAIDQVLAALDRMGTSLRALDDGGAQPETTQPETTRPEAARPEAAPSEPVHAIRHDLHDTDAVLRGVTSAERQLAVLRPRLEGATDVLHLIALIDSHLAGLETAAADRGRLAKTRSLVDELRSRYGALRRDVIAGVEHVERDVRQIGETAARLRLVPGSALFRFLERAARDAAHSLGKRVTFAGHGGDVRVDGETLSIVQGALLQLVRNAVAHGIEAGPQRLAAGKPADGRVTVTIARRGSAIVFTCADDGAGINFDAVRAIARRKGIAAADASTPESLLRALFRGGISTAATVTDVSGRGIGLDIVRDAAERLGGSASMRSEPGRGAVTELVIPSSIQSFEALLVDAAGVPAAIPLDAVRGTMRVMPHEIVGTAHGDAVIEGGESRRLAPLAGILRPQMRAARPSASCSAVVVAAGADTAVFTVDRINGTASIVARPLPAGMAGMAAIAGASMDASGAPRLVLDPDGLLAGARRPDALRADSDAEPRTILVVDDSLTTRMLEASILESAGYHVTLATSGEEGLEKARAGRHALVLVDVEMPGMDGFTFIEHLRADAALRDTPAILVTSRASAEDRQRGQDAGAQDYMVKSDFDQARLLNRIKALVH